MAPATSCKTVPVRKLFPNRALVPEVIDIYREQVLAFRRKFGREMGPDDPFFFDPDADTPQFRTPEFAAQAVDLIARMLAQAGIDPAAIYAFKKTRGLFPTRSTNWTTAELLEWNIALNEYHKKLKNTAKQ
jgi:hypothetical protein